MSSTPLFLLLFVNLIFIAFFSLKYLFAFGAFGEDTREELNNIFMKYKSKIELKQKEQCAPSSKSFDFVGNRQKSKKKKLTHLHNEHLLTKINWYLKRVNSEISF